MTVSGLLRLGLVALVAAVVALAAPAAFAGDDRPAPAPDGDRPALSDAGAGGDGVHPPPGVRTFAATLDGRRQTGPDGSPAGDLNGRGTAEVWLDAGRLCYTLSWTLSGSGDEVRTGHLHGTAGPSGSATELFSSRAAPDDRVQNRDGGGTARGCAAVSPDVASSLTATPGDYYVNLHTDAFPAGALLGQLDAGAAADPTEATRTPAGTGHGRGGDDKAKGRKETRDEKRHGGRDRKDDRSRGRHGGDRDD
jgi:hypothetical protein